MFWYTEDPSTGFICTKFQAASVFNMTKYSRSDIKTNTVVASLETTQ